MKSKYFLGERIKLNDDKEIVLYINTTSKLYVYIFLNSLEISRQDLQKIVNARFNCHIEIYESTYKNIKNYILSLDYTKYRLKYDCLITDEQKIIDCDNFLKNISMCEFIKKFNTDILINIEPCIDIIFMDYKAIKFNHFLTIIKYASAGLFDVNEHNISIYFKEKM